MKKICRKSHFSISYLPVLVNSNQLVSEDVLNIFNNVTPGIKLVNNEDLTLLGAPIYREGIHKVLEPKLKSLELMCERLSNVDSHEATFLMKNALSIPKLNYFLRTAPCFQEINLLEQFDKTLLVNV